MRNLISFLCLASILLTPGISSATGLSLPLALSEARSNSPKLQQAASTYKEASWKHTESFSEFLPSVNIGANYLLNKKYAFTDLVFGGSPVSVPNVVPTTTYTLSAELPIFDGFANIERFSASKEFEHAANQQLDWTRFEMDRTTILQFYKALAAKILQSVSEQNVRTLEDHLRDVRLFKKSGVTTNFNVLRVEVQVSEARSEWLNAVDNVTLERNKLGEILGKESENREVDGKLPILSEDILKKLPDISIESRSDLAASEGRSNAYASLSSAAGRFWVPKIALMGMYQYYNNRNDQLLDRSNLRDAYQVGINLNWNIFDGLVSISKSKESVEKSFQEEKNQQIARIQAQVDLDLWKRKFAYYCGLYRARASDVEKAEESVRLAKAERKVGTVTNSELLDTETELFRARAGVVNAQMGAVEALLKLELASGKQLYEFN